MKITFERSNDKGYRIYDKNDQLLYEDGYTEYNFYMHQNFVSFCVIGLKNVSFHYYFDDYYIDGANGNKGNLQVRYVTKPSFIALNYNFERFEDVYKAARETVENMVLL